MNCPFAPNNVPRQSALRLSLSCTFFFLCSFSIFPTPGPRLSLSLSLSGSLPWNPCGYVSSSHLHFYSSQRWQDEYKLTHYFRRLVPRYDWKRIMYMIPRVQLPRSFILLGKFIVSRGGLLFFFLSSKFLRYDQSGDEKRLCIILAK